MIPGKSFGQGTFKLWHPGTEEGRNTDFTYESNSQNSIELVAHTNEESMPLLLATFVDAHLSKYRICSTCKSYGFYLGVEVEGYVT